MKNLTHLHFPPIQRNAVLLLLLLWLLPLILSACGGGGVPGQVATVTRTPTITFTPTRLPTLTPTPEPLGAQSNPFVIGVVSETSDPLVAAATEELARRIAADVGKTVIARVYTNYPALLEDMEKNQVHITWMPPLTYLYASQRGLTRVALLTNQFGVYQYGAQFMANVESEYTPYYDPVSGLTSADAATALPQFADSRACFVDPMSPSGYIVPAGLLAAQSVNTLQPPVFVQSHTAVVRALYIKGICDFGVSFSISGDPRTASAVYTDLPDTLNRVIIIWRSDPVIPNLSLSFAYMSERNRQALVDAVLNVAKTPEGKELLATTAGNYRIEDLKVVDDSLYNPLRQYVDALDINLPDLIGK